MQDTFPSRDDNGLFGEFPRENRENTPPDPDRRAADAAFPAGARREHPGIAACFRAMAGRPPAGRKALEEAVFAECLAAKARAEARQGRGRE